MKSIMPGSLKKIKKYRGKIPLFHEVGIEKDLNKEKLPTCVSKGYLVSQKNGVTRIFTDYIKSKDKPTFDSIGNTTIIPTDVIESIKKLN